MRAKGTEMAITLDKSEIISVLSLATENDNKLYN